MLASPEFVAPLLSAGFLSSVVSVEPELPLGCVGVVLSPLGCVASGVGVTVELVPESPETVPPWFTVPCC